MSAAIRYEVDESVVVITIDRPEVANAIDRPTAEALADAFRRFDADDSLAVAVLTGANGKFCAGADLKAMREGDPARVTRVAPDGDGPVGPTRMLLGKPVIAAVEGHAAAGGIELAAWCDLRVAAEDAVFGVFCRRWGIPLMDGGTIRLARLLGHSHALDLILTGRGVSGEEALRMGLANRLVPPGRALPEAIALARELAALPQAALRSDRLSSYEQWSLGLEEALSTEYRHGMATLTTGEMHGGLDLYASGDWRNARHASERPGP
jgi:enoyl-CoA hydratase